MDRNVPIKAGSAQLPVGTEAKNLSEEIFAEGIETINSILTPNMRIQDLKQIDTYYKFLAKYSNEEFIAGVDLLVEEWKNPMAPPTIKTIEEYIEKAKYGLEEEEISLLKEIERYTGMSFLKTDKEKV